MSGVVLYCRPGFEGECAAEIQDKAGALGIHGYCKAQPMSGLVAYHCMPEEADHIARKIAVRSLIFARQLFVQVAECNQLALDDRISPMIDAWQQVNEEQRPLCGVVWVETADTNEGRQLSGLTKSISTPLRKALRAEGILTEQDSERRPVLHVLFRSTHSAILGYSYTYNNSPYLMGIPRIRAPKGAPSRSAAKLAEAFKTMIAPSDLAKKVTSGMRAVDLGACPGGWTAVLVQQGMMVDAVDNGPIDEALMETGQVKHFREDGFVFRPKKRNIDWLVCDMVEKPVKVTHLMADWFIEGYCRQAMFNLKLPMKKRYQAVQQYMEALHERLREAGIRHYELSAKHLYHDREEVTLYLRVTERS